MEKLLLAIDALNPDRNSAEFACFLARLTKSKITGVFLESAKVSSQTEWSGVDDPAWPFPDSGLSDESARETIEKNILFFQEKCFSEEVPCRFHRNRGAPLDELIEESRFADLLVIDADMSLENGKWGRTNFLKALMRKAECPVVIAPANFEGIQELIFTYDGSASAIFAIKQFTYLFPQLYDRQVTILRVNKSGEWNDPDKYKLSEWLKEHYTDLHFKAITGEPGAALFDFLLRKKDVFVIMGAYGRNTFSTFFSRSHADLIVDIISRPVFITHH